METLQLVILLLFIIFFVIPAIIFLGILGVAAIAANNLPPPSKEVLPEQPPPNLKPSPITPKYVCPNSKVCAWASSPHLKTCSAMKTEACNLDHVTEECNAVAKLNGSDTLPFIYETDTQIICENRDCEWSDPDPVTKEIKLKSGINCRLEKAKEYCRKTGGQMNTGVTCIYKNPM